MQDIKVQLAQKVSSYGPGSSPSPEDSAYKGIAKFANDKLSSWDTTGGYNQLNKQYNVAVNSLNNLQNISKNVGTVPNQGASARFKIPFVNVPNPIGNFGGQQAVIQASQLLPKILPKITSSKIVNAVGNIQVPNDSSSAQLQR